jgi:hypothetical protein
VEQIFTTPCRCIGPTLVFEAGTCFTCGRLHASEIAAEETTSASRAGLLALAEAIGRTRRKLDAERTRLTMDLSKARRVVIEPPKRTEPRARAERARVERAPAVRELEFLTRTF